MVGDGDDVREIGERRRRFEVKGMVCCVDCDVGVRGGIVVIFSGFVI